MHRVNLLVACVFSPGQGEGILASLLRAIVSWYYGHVDILIAGTEALRSRRER